MFDFAKPLLPCVQTKCFSFCTEQVVSDCWLLLPGTTGFVDPLLSTGFVLNLLGIERLGRWMEGGMSVDELKQYEWDTIADLRVTEAIVSGLYRCMKPMGMGPSESRKFSALTMLYFAAASFSETVRRLGKPELARGFLLRGNVEFHSRMTSILMDIDQDNADRIDSRVRELIEPFNIAGLLNLKRKNWYPVDLDALRQSGVKVSSSELEIASMLGKSLGVGIDPGR